MSDATREKLNDVIVEYANDFDQPDSRRMTRWPEVEEALAAYGRAVKAEALREAANAWFFSAWADTPRKADRIADRMAASQYAGEWLNARADEMDGS